MIRHSDPTQPWILQEVAIGNDGRIGEHLVAGRSIFNPLKEVLTKLSEHGHQLEIELAFRPQALDQEFAAVVVPLGLAESLFPVSSAVGATPALDDVEMSPRLATQLEILRLELFLHLLLMSVGFWVSHAPIVGS